MVISTETRLDLHVWTENKQPCSSEVADWTGFHWAVLSSPSTSHSETERRVPMTFLSAPSHHPSAMFPYISFHSCLFVFSSSPPPSSDFLLHLSANQLFVGLSNIFRLLLQIFLILCATIFVSKSVSARQSSSVWFIHSFSSSALALSSVIVPLIHPPSLVALFTQSDILFHHLFSLTASLLVSFFSFSLHLPHKACRQIQEAQLTLLLQTLGTLRSLNFECLFFVHF